MRLSEEVKQIFCEVAELKEIPAGAYNFRVNGKSVGRQSSENIDIKPKTDVSGLEIYIKADTKNETVHIPVAISATGLKETVYNDFHIEENVEATIIAGCGIYNCGPSDSVHDGIHRFYVGKNSKIKYIEKHYGEGDGDGKRILDPVTEIHLGKNSVLEMDTAQIKGVSSAIRTTSAELGEGAKLVINEKIFTHSIRQDSHACYIDCLSRL